MKYVNCPLCNNKIIYRANLKCVYCGYDSRMTIIEEDRLTPLSQPQRPSKEKHTIIQTLMLLACLLSVIGFLLTFLFSKATVVDNVLIESASNVTTFRYVLGAIAVMCFISFMTSHSNYENALIKYNEDLRFIKDINRRIENGARRSDFDEAELAFIIMQEQKQQEAK